MSLFFGLKGVVALLGVVLLVADMYLVRRRGVRLGQWLRYLTLLFIAVLMAGASLDQWSSGAEISWYNIGALVAACLLVATMLVSINEDRNRR